MAKITLSTHEFAKQIAEATKGETSKRMTIDDVKTLLRIIPSVIGENVVEGNIIRWHGFMDIFGDVKEAGKGKDPRSGKEIDLPIRMLCKTKMSRTYKDAIKAEYAAK